MSRVAARKSDQPPGEESKRDAFRRIGQRRVTAAREIIRKIGNLSNRNNYDYHDREVEKIFEALQEAIDKARAKFKTRRDTEEFTFD
jgi:hypothetical protein